MQYCSLLLEILEPWKLKVFLSLASFKLCLLFLYKWNKNNPFWSTLTFFKAKNHSWVPDFTRISFVVFPAWYCKIDLFMFCWVKTWCVNMWMCVNWSVKKGHIVLWNRLLIQKLKQTRKNFAVRCLNRGFWIIESLYSIISKMFMTFETWLAK